MPKIGRKGLFMSLASFVSTLTDLKLDDLVTVVFVLLAVIAGIVLAVLVLEQRFTSRSPKQRRDIVALIAAWRRSRR